LNTEKVVTLDDVIDERLVNKFYQQAIRPTFNQKLSSLIQEKALLRIKLALMTSFEQVNLPRKAHKKWPEVEENGIFRELTVLEVAEQLRTLFGSPNQSETTIDLDRQLTAIVFSFSYNNPLLEQNYRFTFTNIVNDFYRNIPDTLTPERKSQMAKIFSDNLRKDNEITRLYKIQTKVVVGKPTPREIRRLQRRL
jgi:hypothetical protein